MPKLDGFDVFKALQASNESETLNSKILVLSAQTEPHLVEELAKLGTHRTMTNPLHISELLALVEEASPKSTWSLAVA
jgi:DNA-binding response OmpR family regulator